MENRHKRVGSQTNRISQVRSGIPSFDQILSGGIPIGSLLLIEESSKSDISHIFSKAFLGEGAVTEDHLLFYSESLENYVPDIRRIGNQSIRGDTTVRYETFPLNSQVQEPYIIDLSTLKSECKTLIQRTIMFTDEDFYRKLWSDIKNDLQNLAASFPDPQVRRILINSIFSPNWPQQSLSEIFEFLKSVKTLLRSRNAVCMLSVPVKKLHDPLRELLFRVSDLVILNRSDESEKNFKACIYKAPKSTNVEENSTYIIYRQLGTTVIEEI